jgi:regulatory protein
VTDAERCYAAALRILGYRFNSEQELRRKLQAKQFEKDVVEETIVRLRGEKWLDDERFAGALARTRSVKRVGKRRILRELHAAGVGEEAARNAVDANVDEEREREGLQALCEKRARLLIRRHGAAYLDTAVGRNKLAGYLLNQGYDAALVSAAVHQLIKELRVAHSQPDS